VYASVCVLLTSALVATDVLTRGDGWLGWWPLVGWGMALVILAAAVFSRTATGGPSAAGRARGQLDGGRAAQRSPDRTGSGTRDASRARGHAARDKP
jgi:hypothetical protein